EGRGTGAADRDLAAPEHGVRRDPGAGQGIGRSAAVPRHAGGPRAADHAPPRVDQTSDLIKRNTMQLRPEALDGHLAKGLAPLYVITSDEHLLALEAADKIRRAARAQGYSERDVLTVERSFKWGE